MQDGFAHLNLGLSQLASVFGPAQAGPAAPTANLVAPGTPGSTPSLVELLGTLTTTLKNLAAWVGTATGTPAPATNMAAPTASAPMQAIAPNPNSALVDRVTADPRLKPAVATVANDPVGNKLLTAAVQQGMPGVTVNSLLPNRYGETSELTRGISIGQIALPNNDLVRTIAHEALHAATLGNGDSILEEQLADQIGTAIQARTLGVGPGYTLDIGGGTYGHLPQDNGIRTSLAQMGIDLRSLGIYA